MPYLVRQFLCLLSLFFQQDGVDLCCEAHEDAHVYQGIEHRKNLAKRSFKSQIAVADGADA